ncbi:hypothetical protein [Vibrio phage VP4B]|uniref:Uncharacterized protein n=1 Tax=Vibrio phage VP4B TaxID=1262540 RepID=V9LZZ1_9CAUD|nr:hypothetical protein FDJ61_gp146 [Vibrio phage VP4B]AGB07260.1 hypothetical protein [Vibrio phage VP4B]
MSHNNPNFPQQPFTRAAAGRQIDDPSDNWNGMNTMPQNNMGMPQMGMPSMNAGMPSMGGTPAMGQRQMSPIAQLEAVSRQIGLDNDYAPKTTTNNDYSVVNEFINGGAQGGDQDLVRLKTEEAKSVVAALPIAIMGDFQHRKGHYSAFEVAINEFAHKFTTPNQVQIVYKFRDMINNSLKFRQNIGFNVGVIVAANTATAIINDKPHSLRETNLLLLGALDNVIAMELVKWLSASTQARNELMAEGQIGQYFRRRLADQFRDRRDHVNESFNFLNVPSPYDGMESKMEIVMDMSSDPTPYAHNPTVHGYRPPSLNFGDVGAEMSGRTMSDEELLAYNRHLEETFLRPKPPTMPEPSYNHYEEEAPTTIVFGESHAPREDLEEMTAQNHEEFDWMSKLVVVPKSQLWTADNETVDYLRNAFYDGRYDCLRTAPGCLTVFTLDINGKPNSDDRIINLGGRPMETFLTNPKLLLPLLEETPAGVVEVEQVEVKLDENEQYDLAALKEAAKATPNIRNTLIEDFASSDLEAYDREAEVIHFGGKREGIVHATSNVEIHYQGVVLGNPEEVKEVYRTMGMLVKGNEQNLNYFDWIKTVYTALGQRHIEKGEFLQMVDSYLSQELERHVVDRYGFSNDSSHARPFTVDTLTDCFLDAAESIQRICPEAYEELSNVKTSRTLIAKSQCLLDHVEGLMVMCKNARIKSRIVSVENYNASIRVCFAREVIVTRVSNMVPPVERAEETVAVMKRSENPDFFSVITAAYTTAIARLHEGAEQIVIFTDVPKGGRWVFQTNRYDGSNVGSIRKVKPNHSNLTIMPLETTHRL